MEKFSTPIVWDKEVWRQVHNPVTPDTTKTTIWEQIHLNFLTTYKFNQFRTHSNEKIEECPLCRKIPKDIYHLILNCQITLELWQELEKTIEKIIPQKITEMEMAFGLIGEHPKMILRNWMTYTLREVIQKQEYIAYKATTN